MKYIVIGLGNYGGMLAEELTVLGHEVIGVDVKEHHVDRLKDKIATAFVLDATDEMALSVLPLKSVDVVIVAIGEDLGASVRVVSLLKRIKLSIFTPGRSTMCIKRCLRHFRSTVFLRQNRMLPVCWCSCWN